MGKWRTRGSPRGVAYLKLEPYLFLSIRFLSFPLVGLVFSSCVALRLVSLPFLTTVRPAMVIATTER
jgi:hypothetical protein